MMLHDVYQNGQVLQRSKYRYLGLRLPDPSSSGCW